MPVLAASLLPSIGFAQTAPNVTIELLALDPANASVVPLDRAVYGHIAYQTDAPVRLLLLPYRNGEPIQDITYSGSPDYAPGSGETLAWFSFRLPQRIDEIRAVAKDDLGNVVAEASVEKAMSWVAGAAAPPAAEWVERLRQAPRNIVPPPPPGNSVFGSIAVIFVQLLILCVPLSVVLQIYALRKFEGGLKQLARVSAFAMAALWIFVILTSLAGSNLSPIWIVFLSPLFVLFLAALFIARSKGQRESNAIPSRPGG